MPDLTKTRTVIPLASGRDAEGDAWYQHTPDDDSDLTGVSVSLPVEVFTDMGRPEKITVTVEPGDTLNA